MKILVHHSSIFALQERISLSQRNSVMLSIRRLTASVIKSSSIIVVCVAKNLSRNAMETASDANIMQSEIRFHSTFLSKTMKPIYIIAIPTNFLVFKTLISVKKIQKQVILSYKNALFSPSTQIKEIPYKNS